MQYIVDNQGIKISVVVPIDEWERMNDKIIDKPNLLDVFDEKSNNKKSLTLDDFSFRQAREKTQRYKGSISDAIIEERRNEL